eukprot:gnl/TRDRNA2_/TRDRNA2_80462_c0_seq2.p1 gnl/TRDRNA2_/TRDRNA2_80462_c0~~gnl/TRDRNA2_/TRDRNA2_80462_c0_seq2.p1  ORF type:complete len:210 (-),score=25.09 gnl/TRDRNA2_/TRDRNA2_80462_c0_seq2:2-631(-)
MLSARMYHCASLLCASLTLIIVDQVHSLRFTSTKPAHKTDEHCPAYKSEELHSIVSHVDKFFNRQTPRPLGDGVTPWQLTLVQALRLGQIGVETKFRIRSAGDANESLVSFHATEGNLSAQEAADEQLFRSVWPSDWLRIIKEALELQKALDPNEQWGLEGGTPSLRDIFAGDSDMDFAFLGNVSDDNLDPALRAFEEKMTSEGQEDDL